MVVRNPITHRVVGTDDIQKRGEEWESMSGKDKACSEGRCRKQKMLPWGGKDISLSKCLESTQNTVVFSNLWQWAMT